MVYTVDTSREEQITILSIIHRIWAPVSHFTRKCVLAKGSPNIKSCAYNEAVGTEARPLRRTVLRTLWSRSFVGGIVYTVPLHSVLNEDTQSPSFADPGAKNNLRSRHSFAALPRALHPCECLGLRQIPKVCWVDPQWWTRVKRAPVQMAMSERKAMWLQSSLSSPSWPHLPQLCVVLQQKGRREGGPMTGNEPNTCKG